MSKITFFFQFPLPATFFPEPDLLKKGNFSGLDAVFVRALHHACMQMASNEDCRNQPPWQRFLPTFGRHLWTTITGDLHLVSLHLLFTGYLSLCQSTFGVSDRCKGSHSIIMPLTYSPLVLVGESGFGADASALIFQPTTSE